MTHYNIDRNPIDCQFVREGTICYCDSVQSGKRTWNVIISHRSVARTTICRI